MSIGKKQILKLISFDGPCEWNQKMQNNSYKNLNLCDPVRFNLQ